MLRPIIKKAETTPAAKAAATAPVKPEIDNAATGGKRPAPGEHCVTVVGFDYKTTNEQVQDHMSKCGTIVNLHRVRKGVAEVAYESADEAAAAVEMLTETTIDGNSRFIEVKMGSRAKEEVERPAKRPNKGGGKWGGGGHWDTGGLWDMGNAMMVMGSLLSGGMGLGMGKGFGKGFGDDFGKGFGKGSGKKGKSDRDYNAAWTVDKSGGELGEFTGIIKSFVPHKNYGFITSEETDQGDIFLHGAEKKNFRIGSTVKFTCVLNAQGKPNAINLRPALV